MEQASWFDFKMETDPLFKELERLDTEDKVQVAGYTLSKNEFGLYEIEGPDSFDCRSTIEACYQYLNK